MKLEHRTYVKATPQTIFAIYEAVDRWHTWDPDTKKAFLDGPFAVGTRGKLTPAQGRTVPMLLTEVVPTRSFTVESRIPLFSMLFEHELRAVAGVTRVIHRVTLSGALTRLIGPTLARRIDQGLPVALARLKSLAETGAVA